MVTTRNSRVLITSVTTRKVGAKSCEAKYLPSHLWCNSCSESSNRSTREKIRSCCFPWVIKDDSKSHRIKHYYFIQEHFNNVLQPLSYSVTSIASMLSRRESHLNISIGSPASINSSDPSSSIVSITENEASIQVIDVQVNKFEDEIAFAIALDLNRVPRSK